MGVFPLEIESRPRTSPGRSARTRPRQMHGTVKRGDVALFTRSWPT
jgi:hypothetical protein